MCAVCGSLDGSSHWAEDARDAVAREHLIRRILATKELGLRPWRGGGYVVVRSGGASELAPSLSSLWAVVDRAAGQPVDPLDPAFLDRLARGMDPA